MEQDEKKELGLGDVIEKVIDTVVPKVIIDEVKARGCNCEKKKIWLNNFGAIFG